MTDQYVLSFDSGRSNGVALGKFSDDSPYELVEAWQFGGGAMGLKNFIYRTLFEPYEAVIDRHKLTRGYNNTLHIVAEKFTPLQNKGFSLTMGAVEPLRGEGVLIALDVMPDYPDPTWRRPNSMYLYGGNDKKAKLKAARAFLKEHGMLQTGKMVQCKDADDANSAILHGISYVAQVLKHKPTMKMILGRG